MTKKLNHYETVFIMTPVLSEDQIKETVKRCLSYFKKNKVEIIFEENWGLKKLKYPIDNKKSGFYYLIEYKSDGSFLDQINVDLKRDDSILRWITVKLDKYAMEYAESRRKRLTKTEKSDE